MAARLPTGPRSGKSESDLRSDTSGVLYEAIPRGERKLVAASCGVSPDRIDQQVLGSAANWLEQIARLMDRLLAERVERDQALLPLHFLAERYGLELTPVLEVLGTVGVSQAVSSCIREAGEACSEALDAVRDGKLDELERGRAVKQSHDLVVAAHRLVAELEAAGAGIRRADERKA